MQEQITSNILMIRPVNFDYNEETAYSNKFQKKFEKDDFFAQDSAQESFDFFVKQLKINGINIFLYEDTPEPFTPDSIFPNNWISMHYSGKVILYPMEAENRRAERRMDIVDDLRKHFDLDVVLDFSHFEKEGKFLEGTGSLVLDRMQRIAYACLSSRTNEEVLKAWQKQMNGYEVVKFHASDRFGEPIYHTNVMMCMGDNFCVVCLESVKDLDERLMLKQKLESTGKEIIEITLEQMEDFAGNMLLVKNNLEKKFLVMSEKALNSLTPVQVNNLEEKAEILACDLGVIETLGGGSARCMLAEIHLPKLEN
jgi:hypothetical protein